MKPPTMIKVVAAAQAITAVVGLILTAIVIWTARSPEILGEKDAASIVRGLWVGAAVLGIPSLLEAGIALGLWHLKRWSWWAGACLNGALTLLALYSFFDQKGAELDDFLVVVFPAVLCTLYFVKSVRQRYLDKSNVPSVERVGHII